MTISVRVRSLARHILDGDDSVQAANHLESAILDDHAGDEAFDELLEALALYAPGRGRPYVDTTELGELIARTLADEG